MPMYIDNEGKGYWAKAAQESTHRELASPGSNVVMTGTSGAVGTAQVVAQDGDNVPKDVTVEEVEKPKPRRRRKKE